MQLMPHDSQSAFSAGLLTGGPVPDGVVDPFGNPAPKRYGVYQNNVVVSLIESLKSTFPAILGLLGEDMFSQMARAYIVHAQPQSPILAEYGREMSQFLELSEPLQQMPFLADVARIDLAWLKSYHGADAEPLGPQALAGLGNEELVATRFKLHPCTQVLHSDHAVFDLWAAGRGGDAMDGIDITQAQHALITRPDVEVFVVGITPVQGLFFESIAGGATLGYAVETAMGAGTFDLPASLQLMISSGAMTPAVA